MAFTSEYMVEIEEAQNLERDLAQSKEANAGLMRACDKLEREIADMTKQINPYEREAAKAAINALKRELAEVTKQRDHYKKACDQYSEDEMLCKLAEVTKQRDALAEGLDKALAAVKGGSHE
jgi:cytochrome c556